MKLKTIFVWYRSLAAPFSRSLRSCAERAFYCRKLPSSDHAISTQFQCHEQHKKQSCRAHLTVRRDLAQALLSENLCTARFVTCVFIPRQMMWENQSSCLFFFGWESFYVRAVTCEFR